MYVSYVGKLFLRMLKALILPLIVPSLIAAVGALDMSLSGKVRIDYLWNCFSIFQPSSVCNVFQVGRRAVGYYMATTVIAVILGIILVSAIRPGGFNQQGNDDINKVRQKEQILLL